VLGYAALALGVVHGLLSMGDASGANTAGIWFAVLALLGLGVQAFIGTSLQSPGVYRAPLRSWHTLLFWGLSLLVLGHIVLNAPFLPQMGAHTLQGPDSPHLELA